MLKRIIEATGAPKRIGAYSLGIQAGDFLFLSGNIGFDPDKMEIVSDDIEIQTTRVMENIKATLEASGATFQDVVKTTIYLKNLEDLGAVNKVYKEYFLDEYPARAMVQVAGIAEGAKLEVDAIAFLPHSDSQRR